MEKKPLLGAHVSIATGVDKAPKRADDIGANIMQIFTSNQKQWNGKKYTTQEIALWKESLCTYPITHIMSHASYLVNLGSPKEDLLAKSRHAFQEEITRCHLLDVQYLNFHPGAATDKNTQLCLDTIIASLLSFEPLISQGSTRLLLETTAGQGTSVGHLFSQLGYIIRGVFSKIPIGVCIDTCHIFAAGYDIRTPQAWKTTLDEFEKEIGLSYLYAFHLNDSVKDLGSKRDRHANLGEGKIGLESFKFLIQDPLTKDLPKYLETPNGDIRWKEEIALLNSWATTCVS